MKKICLSLLMLFVLLPLTNDVSAHQINNEEQSIFDDKQVDTVTVYVYDEDGNLVFKEESIIDVKTRGTTTSLSEKSRNPFGVGTIISEIIVNNEKYDIGNDHYVVRKFAEESGNMYLSGASADYDFSYIGFKTTGEAIAVNNQLESYQYVELRGKVTLGSKAYDVTHEYKINPLAV